MILPHKLLSLQYFLIGIFFISIVNCIEENVVDTTEVSSTDINEVAIGINETNNDNPLNITKQTILFGETDVQVLESNEIKFPNGSYSFLLSLDNGFHHKIDSEKQPINGVNIYVTKGQYSFVTPDDVKWIIKYETVGDQYKLVSFERDFTYFQSANPKVLAALAGR